MTEAELSAQAWERHLEDQARAWLRLTFEQRLEWLEGAKEFAREALGAAYRDPPRKAEDSAKPSG